MGKTLVINMKDIVIEGDILDVAGDITGIIYNISKEIDDEISVDYVDGENKSLLKHRKYGACTFFFNLNKVWGSRKKDRIIKEISQYLNKDGEIYIIFKFYFFYLFIWKNNLNFIIYYFSSFLINIPYIYISILI